jgi:hypothetical protein
MSNPVVSVCNFHVAGTVHKMESLTPFRMAVAASGGSGSATGKNLLYCPELKCKLQNKCLTVPCFRKHDLFWLSMQ